MKLSQSLPLSLLPVSLLLTASATSVSAQNAPSPGNSRKTTSVDFNPGNSGSAPGKPDVPGRPEVPGKPPEAGQPDGVGKRDNPGRPEWAGNSKSNPDPIQAEVARIEVAAKAQATTAPVAARRVK